MFKAFLKGDVIISAVIFMGALYLYRETETFGSLEAYGKLGPAYWPKFLLISLILLSLVVGFNTVRKVRRGIVPKWAGIKFDSGKLRFFMATGLIMAYLLLLKVIGFLVLTPFVMMAFMFLLGEKNKAWIFTIPFILTVTVVLLFTKAMYVPLPRGSGIFLSISHLIY